MNYYQTLQDKISNKKAVISVIGLGYVGLPLIIRYVEEGYKVIGFDIDPEKIDKLKRGESYIKHIPFDLIQTINAKGFVPTNDFTKIADVDAIIICVPTPLNKYREPDISFIVKTMEAILPYLKKGQVVSLESTTYPGTTEEEIGTRVIEKGFQIGEDIFIVFSPEREDPGNKKFNTKNIPKIVSGMTEKCALIAKSLYGAIVDAIVPVSSTKVAEMTKLLENIHRAVNIGLVNEMKVVADKMGIDIHEVIKAAATKPFGFVPYYPGPGLGGHCIPIDPFYLTWKAREFGIHTRFIELAGEVNSSMPDYVVDKIMFALNQKEKSLKGSRVLILGIAYKKNVDDMRESPSVFIMERLREKGVLLEYSDSYFPQFPKMREHSFNMKSIPITKENLESFDCVLVATDHDDFDYDFILKHSSTIVDSRGKYLFNTPKVIRA